MTCKKVVCAGDEQQSFRFGRGGDNLLQLCRWRIFVAISAQKKLGKFGKGAVREERIFVVMPIRFGGQTECDEASHIRLFLAPATTSFQRHGRAKAESRQHQRALV